MNDEQAAQFYASPDGLRAGARVTPTSRPRLNGHVPVRFPQSTIDQMKALAAEDGTTVSTWIRKIVEKAIVLRAVSETRPSWIADFRLEGPEGQITARLVDNPI